MSRRSYSFCVYHLEREKKKKDSLVGFRLVALSKFLGEHKTIQYAKVN